jgi:putative ABC transport system substrate-binding protein
MKRRELIALLGGAAAASALRPRGAGAQQGAVPVIGFLHPGSPELTTDYLTSFHQGLSEAGYFAGRNVMIEYRWAQGVADRLPALAADLVDRRVSVISATGVSAALAAKAATAAIPVVFFVGVDPVELGLVASLNRPGGNLTGLTNLNVELGPKRLQLLHELIPRATVIALLVNPTNPATDALVKALQAAAHTLGVQLQVMRAGAERDFAGVFEALPRLRAGALVIGADAFFNTQSRRIANLTVQHTMPAIYQFRDFAAAGGLMSYGGSLAGGSRLAGGYTGRTLKGEKPADLPVQQFTKIELILNLKTARTLGITVPISLLGRADEVIE